MKGHTVMKKFIALVLALVLMASCFAGCSGNANDSDLAYIQNKGKLVVGITEYEPMDYKDENGQWTGFDAELARLFAAELGVECEFFVIADWSKKFYELETKNIDVIWNGMTITDEVKLNTSCSDPYIINAQVVVMNADVVNNYPDTASLKDLTIAVENGSAGQDAANTITGANVVPLQDQGAALLDQHLSAFLLHGLVVPGVGEGDFHGGGGAHRADAQEEGGVAGLHFRVGVSADVADLGLLSGDLALGDHLVQLQTSGNASQEAALEDGGEGIVVVGQVLGVSLGAGGMAELNLGELQGSLDHVGLVAEGVSEDDIAAVVSQLAGGVIALLAFGDVGLHDVSDAQLVASFLGSVDEVQVVGGVFIVQEDEADLDVFLGNGSALGHGREAAQAQNQNQNQSRELFHNRVLLEMDNE